MEIDNLVERITREVLQALGSQPAAPASSASAGNPENLVIFAGTLAQLRVFLSKAGSPSGMTLALPRDSSVRRNDAEGLGLGRIVYLDEGQRLVDLVAAARHVTVPVFHFNQLANLAGLCDSCWDVHLVLKALAQGVPVHLQTEHLEVAAPFRGKVDSYLKEIASYGISVSSSIRTQSVELAPPPPNTVGQPQPSAHHHPHDASSPCQLKAVGECAGLGQCPRHLPERVGIILEHGAERLSTQPGVGPVGPELARYIDHTLLKPDATREQVLQLCQEARQYSFASVCVNPSFVRLAADALRGSDVKVCTVVGFPLGATTTVTKAMETRDAVANGADEIDMVINVGALKAHNDSLVRHDMEAVVEAADGRIVKVILETALLTDEEKVRACNLARAAGVDFVKTSTGFGPGGATAHDIALMRQTVGRYMGVKASGGIRDLAVAQEMIQAGATRIGASASVPIVKGEASAPAAKSTAKQAY